MKPIPIKAYAWVLFALHPLAHAEVTPIGEDKPQLDGLVTVTLAIPTTVQGDATSLTVARVMRSVVANTPGFTHKDLEALLDQVDEAPHAALWREAEKQREKADLALSMMDLPVASDAYAQALIAYEQAAAGVRDIGPIVDALDKQATALVLQNDVKGAKLAWDRALALDPGFRSNPQAAARVLKAFDDVVRNYKTPAMGKLTLFTSSGGAEVWVDGVPRGVAPLTIDVAAGRHIVSMARDGFRSFGTTVDVKKGLEATVQAALKPTSGYAKLDALMTRAARNPDSDSVPVEIARFLKVDRLVVASVAQTTTAVTLTGRIVDGVQGTSMATNTKAMASEAEFFERDVVRFVEGLLKDHDRKMAEQRTYAGGDDKRDLLVGDATQVPVPGTVIAGGVLLGLSVLPLAGAITLGVVSLQNGGQYRNRAQVDETLADIKQQWLLVSLGADGLYVATAAVVGIGTFLLVSGMQEWSDREQVLGAAPPTN
jgi:hypothetical protein